MQMFVSCVQPVAVINATFCMTYSLLMQNCVEPSRPQQWGPDLPFFWASQSLDGWLSLLLTKAGDVETNQ